MEISILTQEKTDPTTGTASAILPIYSSCLTRTFLSFLVNSLRGINTLWLQPSHLMRISIPRRIIFQRFVPQGCCFFISTISFSSNSFSTILHTLPFIHHYLSSILQYLFHLFKQFLATICSGLQLDIIKVLPTYINLRVHILDKGRQLMLKNQTMSMAPSLLKLKVLKPIKAAAFFV